MVLYLNDFENDTKRKKAVKTTTMDLIVEMLKEKFGDESVVVTKKKTTVCDEDGNEIDIAGNTILAAVGIVTDIDGFEREAICSINCVAKPWNSSTDKNGKVKIAYTLDDVRQAMEEE